MIWKLLVKLSCDKKGPRQIKINFYQLLFLSRRTSVWHKPFCVDLSQDTFANIARMLNTFGFQKTGMHFLSKLFNGKSYWKHLSCTYFINRPTPVTYASIHFCLLNSLLNKIGAQARVLSATMLPKYYWWPEQVCEGCWLVRLLSHAPKTRKSDWFTLSTQNVRVASKKDFFYLITKSSKSRYLRKQERNQNDLPILQWYRAF